MIVEIDSCQKIKHKRIDFVNIEGHKEVIQHMQKFIQFMIIGLRDSSVVKPYLTRTCIKIYFM